MNRAERRRQGKQARIAGRLTPSVRPLGPDALLAAVAMYREGRLAEADAVFTRILDKDPANADAHHLLGLIAHQRGRHDDAIALMSRAQGLDPGNADIHNNLALALQACGRWKEAAASCRTALLIRPDFVEAHCNLGNALLSLGRPDDAQSCYRNAIALNPAFAGAHFNLGNALREKKLFPEAIAAFRKAIEIKSDYAKAHCNLADLLKKDGRFTEAVEHFDAARMIEPGSATFHTNVIFMQDFDESVDLPMQQKERAKWADAFALPVAPSRTSYANSRDPERRLRIGYVSGDFRRHSAYFGFAPLILEHDHDRFEIYCYAENAEEDEISATLRGVATGWCKTRTMSDADLAARIGADGIDILVDLSGHTEGNRLLVFARKPAPVQMTGIGHLAPGLPAIDYRLTTPIFTPHDEAALYPEAPVYLDTFFGFLPPADSPPVARARSANAGPVIFGYMNRLYKISDRALSLWAQILRHTPDSQLLVKFHGLDQAETRQRFLASFAAVGIDHHRLILIGGTTQRDHLDTYNRIDIALDPFPQGGGISTMESLWMGVPVIGLYDHRKIVNRSIRTVCAPLGLQDWIAESEDDYLRIATGWAARRDELAMLKAGLRDRVKDVYSRFPAGVERAYRIAWRRWCAGEAPQAIHVHESAAPSP